MDLDLLTKLGIPTGGAVILWYLYKGGIWLGKEAILPIVKTVKEFIESVKICNETNSKTLSSINEAIGAKTSVLSNVAETTKLTHDLVSQAHQAISNGCMNCRYHEVQK